MNEFQIRKITSNFPEQGLPSAFYMRKISDDKYELRIGTNTGDKLLKVKTQDNEVNDESVILSGPTAAKAGSNVTVDIINSNTDITSYNVVVDEILLGVITDTKINISMPDKVNSIVNINVTPQDNQGNIYKSITHSILATKKDPIDLPLVISGSTTGINNTSVTLELDNFDNSISGIKYRIASGSWINIDNIKDKPVTVDIPIMGVIGQRIPIEFMLSDVSNNDYLPKFHYIRIIDVPNVDANVTLTGDSRVASNIDYELSLTTNNSDVIGYEVVATHNPYISWVFNSREKVWTIDNNRVAIGTVIDVIALPLSGSDRKYNPVTLSYTVIDPVEIDSNVVIDGLDYANSGEEYRLNIYNNNPDIESYKVIWDTEVVIIDNNPNEWVNPRISNRKGDTVTLTIIPLSKSNGAYKPITKTIEILSKLPINSGIDIIAKQTFPQNGIYKATFIKDNVHEKVDTISIHYEGEWYEGNYIDAIDEWTHAVTGDINSTQSVIFRPKSNDDNYKFKDIILQFVITEAEEVDCNILITGNELVRAGEVNNYYWTSDHDVNKLKIYLDGVLQGVFTNSQWQTPSTTRVVGKRYKVTFVPISDSGINYKPIYRDYVTVRPVEPVYSSVEFSGPQIADVGEDIIFNITNNNTDVASIKIYLDNLFIEEIPGDSTAYRYHGDNTEDFQRLNFKFQAISANHPDRLYTTTDEVVYIRLNGIHSVELSKTGPDTVTPFGTVHWDFELDNNIILSVNIRGNEVLYRNNVNPTGTAIIVNKDIAIGETIQVGITAKADNGLQTKPIKWWPLTIVNWVCHTPPNVTAPIDIMNIPKDQFILHAAPNITPNNFDSIKLIVEASTTETFDTGTVSHWEVPAYNGTNTGYDLPTEIGDKNLDKLLPLDDFIWIRASYLVSKGGIEFPLACVSDPKKFHITPNRPPEGHQDNWVAYDNDQPSILYPLANDSDFENDPLRIIAVTQPQHGLIEIIDDQSLRYTPELEKLGTMSFTYTVADYENETTVTSYIVVSRGNRPPIVNDIHVDMTQGNSSSTNVIDHVIDEENDNISIVSVDQPQHGTANFQGNTVTYTPDPSYAGTDEVTYHVTDHNTHIVAGKINYTITTIPPIAVNDHKELLEHASISFNPLDNDSDPNNDIIHVKSIGQPQHGTATLNNDIITYTGEMGYIGEDVLEYTIEDNYGATDTAIIGFTLLKRNEAPVAHNWQAVLTQGTSVVVDPTLNDTDGDPDDILTISSITQPSHGVAIVNGNDVTYTPDPSYAGSDEVTYVVSDGHGHTSTAKINYTITTLPPLAREDSISLIENETITFSPVANDTDPNGDPIHISSITQPNHGVATFNGNSITYTPTPGFFGTDSMEYHIEDNYGATDYTTVDIVVIRANRPPVAHDWTIVMLQGSSVTVDPTENDTDIDINDNLVITAITDPDHGVISRVGNNVTYTPDASYAGYDEVTYTLSDGHGHTDTAKIKITVNTHAPVAYNDSVTLMENSSKTFNPIGNDVDEDGDPLSIKSIDTPEHGTATYNGNQITYTPTTGYSGSDYLDYIVTDNHGSEATARVTFTIVNRPPVANNVAVTMTQGLTYTFDPTENDTDIDNDPVTIISITQPAHGFATFNGNNISYTPDTYYAGTDSLTYTISDGHGHVATATVNYTVYTGIPVAYTDNISVIENQSVTFNPLVNDTDPDGDDLIITGVYDVTHGTATFTNDTITFTPTPGWFGDVTFGYYVRDDHGDGFYAQTTGSVNVTVIRANRAPVAHDYAVVMDQGTVSSIDPTENDTDIDVNDVLTVTSITQPSHGTATIGSNNKVNYTPDPSYAGADELTYTISDGHGHTSSAKITYKVYTAIPVANTDTVSLIENQSITFNPLVNDTDPDGDSLIITGLYNVTHGTATYTSNSITYTPDHGYYGDAHIGYLVRDNHGVNYYAQTSGSVNVTVVRANRPPVANDWSAVLEQGDVFTFNPTTNDTDIDNDTLTITQVTNPSHGEITFTNNSVTYTPDSDYAGYDEVNYTISDDHGHSASAKINFTIYTHIPIANTDNVSVIENQTITFNPLLNDTDPDGDSLRVTGVYGGDHGTISYTSNSVTYTPDHGYYGPDNFGYLVKDNHGGSFETQTSGSVNVTIIRANRAPVAHDWAATLEQGSSIAIDPTGNDTDIDANDILTITHIGSAAHGSVSRTGNTVHYTPNANYAGSDFVNYTISDGHGHTASAKINFTITSHPPVAHNDSISLIENQSKTFNPLPNDTDPDGDPIHVTSITQPSHGSATRSGNNITYTPNSNWYGSDSMTYKIYDNHGRHSTATINITVIRANRAPIAHNWYGQLMQGESITIDPTTNDTDIDNDTLTITSVEQPDHGSAVRTAHSVTYTPIDSFAGVDAFHYTISDGHGHTATAQMVFTIVSHNPVAHNDAISLIENQSKTFNPLPNDTDPDGDPIHITSVGNPTHGSTTHTSNSITYTPVQGYFGSDSFTYTIQDNHGKSDTATVTVTVIRANRPPVAHNWSGIMMQATSITIDPTANDTDIDNDTLTIISITQPSHGSASHSGNNVTYTPDTAYAGTDSLTYTISDGHGHTSTATINYTINSHIPVAHDDTVSLIENQSKTFYPLANDTDPDPYDPLHIVSITQPSHGTATKGDGFITYTPTANWYGSDSMTYVMSDSHGGESSATIHFTVVRANRAPVTHTDYVDGYQNEPIVINPTLNDTDIDNDTLTVTNVNGLNHVTVSTSGNTITITPFANWVGTDWVAYYITDHHGHNNIKGWIRARFFNRPPVAHNFSVTTLESTAKTFNPTTNDTDQDGNTLTITAITQPNHGSASKSGNNITYTPTAGYSGSDSMTYTISDGKGGSDTATINITVTYVNKAPVLHYDYIVIPQYGLGSGTIDPTQNDTDVENDTLTVTNVDNMSYMTLSQSGNNLTFTAKPGKAGVDWVAYYITDHHGHNNIKSWIKVTISNTAPEANDFWTSVVNNTTVTFNPTGNDTDAEGNTLTISSITQPPHGSATYSGNNITFTPDAWYGDQTMTYTITDSHGGSDTATVHIHVTKANEAPVLHTDYVTMWEGGTVTVHPLSNDTDSDNDTLTITNVNGLNSVTLSKSGNTLTFTGKPGATGVDWVAYYVSDGHGHNNIKGWIKITINSNPPNAVADTVNLNQDTQATFNPLANDSDPDGDTISLLSYTQPAHGNITQSGNNLIYTPNAGWHGTDISSYDIKDSHDATDGGSGALITWNVAYVPPGPVLPIKTAHQQHVQDQTENFFLNNAKTQMYIFHDGKVWVMENPTPYGGSYLIESVRTTTSGSFNTRYQEMMKLHPTQDDGYGNSIRYIDAPQSALLMDNMLVSKFGGDNNKVSLRRVLPTGMEPAKILDIEGSRPTAGGPYSLTNVVHGGTFGNKFLMRFAPDNNSYRYYTKIYAITQDGNTMIGKHVFPSSHPFNDKVGDALFIADATKRYIAMYHTGTKYWSISKYTGAGTWSTPVVRIHAPDCTTAIIRDGLLVLMRNVKPFTFYVFDMDTFSFSSTVSKSLSDRVQQIAMHSPNPAGSGIKPHIAANDHNSEYFTITTQPLDSYNTSTGPFNMEMWKIDKVSRRISYEFNNAGTPSAINTTKICELGFYICSPTSTEPFVRELIVQGGFFSPGTAEQRHWY